MTTLFVRHNVADYSVWRKTYDDFAPTQKRLGVTAEEVYQAADDPNNLTVTHDFATRAAAEAFLAHPDLRSAMAKGGVVGEPAIWMTKRS